MTTQARIEVAITQLPHGQGLDLPGYQSGLAAGVDLVAAIGNEPQILGPGARALIPTGIAIGLPPGFEAQLRPRSGLALRHGLTLLNAPGTIDADYRGEIGVILINLGQEAVAIERGMRVAQLVVAPVARLDWRAVATLDATARGAGGFGSTGS